MAASSHPQAAPPQPISYPYRRTRSLDIGREGTLCFIRPIASCNYYLDELILSSSLRCSFSAKRSIYLPVLCLVTLNPVRQRAIANIHCLFIGGIQGRPVTDTTISLFLPSPASVEPPHSRTPLACETLLFDQTLSSESHHFCCLMLTSCFCLQEVSGSPRHFERFLFLASGTERSICHRACASKPGRICGSAVIMVPAKLATDCGASRCDTIANCSVVTASASGSSATNDLTSGESAIPTTNETSTVLLECSPCVFTTVLTDSPVALEHVHFDAHTSCLIGDVSVVNSAFEKQVFVRYGGPLTGTLRQMIAGALLDTYDKVWPLNNLIALRSRNAGLVNAWFKECRILTLAARVLTVITDTGVA